jgi:hypothetical protein
MMKKNKENNSHSKPGSRAVVVILRLLANEHRGNIRYVLRIRPLLTATSNAELRSVKPTETRQSCRVNASGR